MKLYDLVFSRQPPQKYYRHILFWSGWLLFSIVTYLLNTGFQRWLTPVDIYEKTRVPVLVVVLEIAFIYPLVYFIIPRLLPHHKFWLFVLLPFYTALCFILYYHIPSKTSTSLINNVWFAVGEFIGTGPLFVFFLFAALRVVKNYYLRMEERETLEREKTAAELQFLKAQIHPHFLFNTLNNIYSFTLTRSPHALALVGKLKNLLRYMTGECNADKVLLEKELKMLNDYLALEKVRYGQLLEIQTNVYGDCNNVMIAPLLMIPFVENSFKHGASKILHHPWIKIDIEIAQRTLFFNITNNKPPQAATQATGGIGLQNVTKRLQLLYPGNHLLTVHEQADTFTIRMQVALDTAQPDSATG